MVLDVVVEGGNPADSTLATKMIDRHEGYYGEVPSQAVYDGGFASRTNLDDIKEMGVKDAAFSKRCGLPITEMVKSMWVYKRLRDFRAGIEGTISFLKRCFKMRRCLYRSFKTYCSSVGSHIFAHNLVVLARC